MAAASPAPSALRRVAAGPWALLTSLLLLMVGAGLEGSLLGLRAEAAGFDVTVTGAILGGYYLGYVAGSVIVTRGIAEVGHIRVYSGLAAIASVVILVHGVWVAPGPWLALRFLSGMCLAGLFVVVESWLNSVAAPADRGRVLGLYMAVITVGLAIGQVLLNVADVEGIGLFILAAAMVALAVVPIALVPHQAPAVGDLRPYPMRRLVTEVPLALAGSAVSGVGAGITLGFGAVYAVKAGLDVGGASLFVTGVLVGAAIGQRPLGQLSDRVDRRWAMVVAGLLTAGASVGGAAATSGGSLAPILAAGAVAGAGVFPLYSLALAHLADYLDPSEVTAGGTRLILVNGLGAAFGPVLVGALIGTAGAASFFVLLGSIFLVLALYAAYRMTRRGAPVEARRAAFVPLPTSATPEVMELETSALVDEIDVHA